MDREGGRWRERVREIERGRGGKMEGKKGERGRGRAKEGEEGERGGRPGQGERGSQ